MKAVKSFRHWTPQYIVDRIEEIFYHRQYPRHPWLTRRAVEVLQDWLKPSDVVVEFGSGRSTLWFAERVAKLTSVEHNPAWYERISRQLEKAGIQNVNYCLFAELESETSAACSRYAGIIEDIPVASVDFVLIDGIFRGYCARRMVGKLRPGGLLVVDNANWFLPCNSRSPGSRSEAQGPADEDWAAFQSLVSGWRHFWTTSGVTDTAFYFKPCEC